MGWALLRAGSTAFDLPYDRTAHVIIPSHSNDISVVLTLHPHIQRELARIITGPFGAKLEAVSNEVNILPPSQTHTGPLAPSTVSVAIDPMTRCYILQPRLGEHSESIIIRHGDTIIFPKVKARLICQWTDSEVQVNSSATDAIHVPDSADVDAVAETPEEETEDEDLDNTITAAPLKPKTSQPRATPSLSNQRSVVIHETPTAARISGEVKYPGAGADGDASKYVDNSTEPVEDTPSSSTAHAFQNEPKAEAAPMAHSGESQDKPKRLSHASASPIIEAFASEMDRAAEARPSRHKKITSSPQVQILPNPTRKRATPVMEEGDLDSESEAVSRVSKRAKRGEDDTHDSRMSNIEVDVSPPRKTTAKGKKRQLEVAKTEAVTEAEDATPSRSQGSSQRSTAAISAEAYDDPTPRVAFSNSAITNTSHAVKFLKKHRGTYVENLTDGFNVLCVKDGDLRKTSKVFLAVAQGIPIVTDKWLLDSAKATHFLSVSVYKLSAPKQEKEWKLVLDDVWGKPQTPFEGYTIHFTKSLKAIYNPFTEIEAVCKAAGAKSITSTRLNTTEDVIALALDEEDAEGRKLMQDGVTCYHRDLITYSILRGSLNLDSDEFRIEAAEGTKEKKKKGRKNT